RTSWVPHLSRSSRKVGCFLNENRSSMQPRGRSYSNTNAKTKSPCLVPNFPCPPAAITKYCFPTMLYVIGVACPPAGNSNFQSSFPESESNARKNPSIDAAVNTNPPADAIAPPKLIDPDGILSV